MDKLAEKLVDNQVKRIENISEKEKESLKKAQKQKVEAELQSLKERQKNGEKLTQHELDRMKKLSDFINDVNTKFTYAEEKRGEASAKASGKAKSALKDIENAYKEVEKEAENHSKAIEKGQEKLESLNKKYDELKNKAKDAYHEAGNAIKELDKELGKLDENNEQEMLDRYYDISDNMKEMQRKNGTALTDFASGMEMDDLKNATYDKLGDISVNDIIQYKELQEEMAFLSSKLTQEQIAQGEAIQKLSKSEQDYQKYLEKRNELEEKKLVALEKQAIAQAFASQETPDQKKIKVDVIDGELKARYENEQAQMVEITDFKNIQYAQDLYNKSESLRAEQAEVTAMIDHEKQALEQLTQRKIELDQQYTNAHNANIDKQKAKLDELINKYKALAQANATLAGGFRAFGGDVKAGAPYLIGENFKPELFIPSTSGSVVPVNNYNQSRSYNFSGVTINANNPQDFWSQIQDYIGDYN